MRRDVNACSTQFAMHLGVRVRVFFLHCNMPLKDKYVRYLVGGQCTAYFFDITGIQYTVQQ